MEILHANRLNVLVEDGGGDEEALGLVVLLLVQVADSIHAVQSVGGAHGISLRPGGSVVSSGVLGLEIA